MGYYELRRADGFSVPRSFVGHAAPFSTCLDSGYRCASKAVIVWAKKRYRLSTEGLSCTFPGTKCGKEKSALLVTVTAINHDTVNLSDENGYKLASSREFVNMGSVVSDISSCNASSNQLLFGEAVQEDLFGEATEEELCRRILALSRSNQVRSALRMFKYMQVSGFQASSHACNSLLLCLVRNNWYENAMELFHFMKKTELTTHHTYSLILKAVANARGCDSAINMFVDIERNEKDKENLDIVVYNTMISILCRANKWIEAEKMWRKVTAEGYQGTLVTYSLLVALFVRCGQEELALDAYNEMVENGIAPRKDAMQASISASVREGRWDFAIAIFETMLARGINPNLTARLLHMDCFDELPLQIKTVY